MVFSLGSADTIFSWFSYHIIAFSQSPLPDLYLLESPGLNPHISCLFFLFPFILFLFLSSFPFPPFPFVHLLSHLLPFLFFSLYPDPVIPSLSTMSTETMDSTEPHVYTAFFLNIQSYFGT